MRERKTERETCKIFVKKNNPGRLSDYIYWGGPCGHRCRPVYPHDLILMYKKRAVVRWGRGGGRPPGVGLLGSTKVEASGVVEVPDL